MSDQKDVVKEADDVYLESVARWILEAADRMCASGYRISDCRSITKSFLSTITRGSHGVRHRQEPFESK